MLYQRKHNLYYVYIMASISRVIYVGVTNNIYNRVMWHKGETDNNSFTSRYRVTRLVYYEEFEYIDRALSREKQLKGWRREKKLKLINRLNPQWQDLSLQWEK
ncbi:GIY-YIG nuclease family protein [Balneolaceae bacterium YR4-1]|uniref:GIY-YIG nuclease family protein n=1 Tax=Halalkalibaculum roseum TaxID=2709311 RepID=A0A6M1SRB9_9BACT|nr:GIY-YIG nuclease family protein [Halalkalibaculum roseum]